MIIIIIILDSNDSLYQEETATNKLCLELRTGVNNDHAISMTMAMRQTNTNLGSNPGKIIAIKFHRSVSCLCHGSEKHYLINNSNNNNNCI